MGNENKNGTNISLIVLIIILVVLCVLFATGILSFNKKQSDDCIKNNNISNSNTNQNDVQSINSKENIINKLVGTYSFKGEYVDKAENDDFKIEDDAFEKGKMAFEKLVLNSNGIAEAESGNMRASSDKAEGKWYVSNNKIIIINDNCKPTIIDGKVEYPNCNNIFEYEYSINDSTIVVTSLNNTIVNRVVLNKD